MTETNANPDPLTTFSPDAMFKMWAEALKLPTIGPMFAFSKELTGYTNEIINLGKVVSELKLHNDNYWTLMNTAFTKAMMLTTERAPKQLLNKEDYENYRRAMIEGFEDAYTELFSSPEFSTVYGKVFSAQLDFSKALQSIAERNMKILNLPTRAEMDEILKDIHELRKSVREVRKALEGIQNDKAGSNAA